MALGIGYKAAGFDELLDKLVIESECTRRVIQEDVLESRHRE